MRGIECIEREIEWQKKYVKHRDITRFWRPLSFRVLIFVAFLSRLSTFSTGPSLTHSFPTSHYYFCFFFVSTHVFVHSHSSKYDFIAVFSIKCWCFESSSFFFAFSITRLHLCSIKKKIQYQSKNFLLPSICCTEKSIFRSLPFNYYHNWKSFDIQNKCDCIILYDLMIFHCILLEGYKKRK